jgi:hypothetical protein
VPDSSKYCQNLATECDSFCADTWLIPLYKIFCGSFRWNLSRNTTRKFRTVRFPTLIRFCVICVGRASFQTLLLLHILNKFGEEIFVGSFHAPDFVVALTSSPHPPSSFSDYWNIKLNKKNAKSDFCDYNGSNIPVTLVSTQLDQVYAYMCKWIFYGF